MINVYSPTETNFKNNGLATLIPISCDFDIGINDKWQLTMEHPFDKELRYQHLVEDAILRVTGFSCVNEQEQDTNRFGLNGKVQLFRVFDTKKTLTSITVIAFPVALEAVYDTPIENLVIQNKTGIQAGEILDAQTQKYSVSSDITRTASSKYENTNLIGAISGNNDDSYVKKWGGEVVYDNNKIKIRNKIGDQSNASAYPIRYGRNLTGLTHEIDMSSVVTRMFPISSDDLRLNVWEDVTSQGGNRYVDSPDHIGDYPFIRCLFVQVDYSLLDTDSNSISETASATNGWREGIINAVTAQATALWTSIIQDLTNTYSPEYIQDLISGEDGIVGYLQKKYVYSHKGWQSFVKSCVKQGVEWIKSEELPTWEWHEDTSVIPHAWWYGDNSVSPAVSYAKNEYVKIGKNYEYFNNDGFWEDYKAMPQSDCDWYEAQDGSGRKWFGYRKGYYAHNEYVYMTVEGQMKEWWYDEEGWYDESRSGDSDMGWHGDASSGVWFGEEGATADDKSKYIHDRWAFIDGTYYWFDTYGYINADPERSFPDWPWGNQKTSEGSLWFGNDSDHGMNAKWLANQWAKIDGEWYYFDADGYVVDMSAKQSETIAWFANTVYNNTIAYITTCLTNAYTLLYRLMTEWCEKQYADGIDLPTVNVSVDLIDLSKTTEYKDYSNLEKISLGDKVLVIGRDGSRYEERVVGLTFDCIRGYNTRVEVGQLSKSVSQIINVSYSGASEGQKIIAGDGVTIDGKVISVGDYVGRTVGLQDVLLNGSTTVSGNVASFGIQAGDNISISRSGNVLTINAVVGGGDVSLYHGIDIPDNSLGDDKDIYLQMKSTIGNLLSFDASHSGAAITNYSATVTDNKWDITATFVDSWKYHSFAVYLLQNLTVGKKYTISFDFQNDGTPPLYGIGELFGLTLQHSNRVIDMRNWSSDLVENGEFKYFENSYYGEWWYQSFPNDTKRVHYEFEFTARQGTEYIGFYGDRTSGNLTCSLYELCVGDKVQTNEIKDIYYKLNNQWSLYDRNVTLYHGLQSPSYDLGNDADIYIQLAPDSNSLHPMILSGYNGERSNTFANNNLVYTYKAVYHKDQYNDGRCFGFDLTEQLEEGKTYLVHLEAQSVDGSWVGSGDRNQSRFYGFSYQKQNNLMIYDGSAVEHVANGGFEYLSQFGDGIYYQSFPYDHDKHTFEFSFVATRQGYFVFYGDDFSPGSDYHIEITNFYVVDAEVEGSKINKTYYKLNDEWVENESGKTYEAGDNILIEDNVISGNYQAFSGTDGTENGASGLVPQPLTTDANKFLKSDGTWAEVQGGSGNVADVYVNGTSVLDANDIAQVFSHEEITEINYDNLPSTKFSNNHMYLIKEAGTPPTGEYYNPVIYSTEEREVGVWIDNKPLYAKSFTLSSQITVSASSWTNTDLLLSDVEKFVNGYAISDDGTFQGSVVIDKSNDVIQLQSTRSTASYVKYLTVFYTKTTDVAGSGLYNTLGVPNVHYSTDEQVIGTWIDGKPLYQKTYSINETIYNQDKTIDVSSLNIDKYVSGEGTFMRHVNWASPVLYIDTPFNLYESSYNRSYLRYGRTNKTIDYGVFLGDNETATDITFTIKYTKTTD